MAIKRYRFFRDQQQDCFCEIDEHEKGDYVLYEDHINEIKKFEEAVTKMEERIKAIYQTIL
jgi:hypothetical protein